MVHEATHKPEPHLSYQMAQTGKLKWMQFFHLVFCLAGTRTNIEHAEMHAMLELVTYVFCDAKWQHPNMMALHMLHLLGRKHIYFFTLIKGHRPNRGKQNIIEKKLATNLIPKSQSLHAFLIKPRFLKELLISELYFLAGLKDKRPKEVSNHCWYYHCNNTHIYSNNYLATLDGWQAGWVSMTEKSRQQALFLFTSWLEKFKSLSNKVFFYLSFNAGFAEN